MVDLRTLATLEDAWDEHDRLTRALAAVRAEQERIVLRVLDDELAPRLLGVAADLQFAIDGARARGVALPRGPGVSPLFLVTDDDAPWSLVERHAHGVNAVVKRVPVGVLLDAFGRSAASVLHAAFDDAARAATLHATPPASARPPGARPVPSPIVTRRTRACPSCDAHPNEENYARHLRTIHGLGGDARPRERVPSATHQVCRLCGARLPMGRLDPHLTAVHGIFHVHPAGNRDDNRRAAALRSTRRTSARPTPRSIGGPTEPKPTAQPGRDFLAEARRERALVARADCPERNRDRQGRFSDAPDVERMDGDSGA